jgi:mannose-6-phosphate isomerase-like protein (cupin superfamily)
MDAVNFAAKLKLFNEAWTPKIVGELNDNHILLAKLEGEFVWHTHAEDELFLVITGKLRIKLRTGEVMLEPGELYIVPKGIEHCPVAEPRAEVMLVEPKITKHTGDLVTERTVSQYEQI